MIAAPEVAVGAVLFTDLVGFTAFNQAEGDAAARRVLEQQTSLMGAALAGRPDARIVKELGDGLMVWCSTPSDGLEVATTMRSAVEGARRHDGFPLAIRMGLHHGEVLPRDDDVVGLTVNVAARIAALAGPGELLVSEAAVEGCAGPPGPMLRTGGAGAGQGRPRPGLAAQGGRRGLTPDLRTPVRAPDRARPTI